MRYLIIILLLCSSVLAVNPEPRDTLEVYTSLADGTWKTTYDATTMQIGKISPISTSIKHFGVQFIPNIPATADVKYAKITFKRAALEGTDNPTCKIRVESGSAAPYASSEDLTLRTYLADTVEWSIHSSADGDTLITPDLSTAIEAWAQEGGHATTDTLAFCFFSTAGSGVYITLVAQDSGVYIPSLELIYTDTSASLKYDTLTGASYIIDGMNYDGHNDYNYGAATQIYYYCDSPMASGYAAYPYYYISFPSWPDTGFVHAKLKLWSNASSSAYKGWWAAVASSRPNIKNYVGNNNAATADSAEMNYDSYFEGGSGDDSAWVDTSGYDVSENDTLAVFAFIDGVNHWNTVEFDSAKVDSMIRGTKSNYGFFVLPMEHAGNAAYYHYINTVENADSTPKLIMITTEAPAQGGGLGGTQIY